MAFTEQERVEVRRWLGFAALFLQLDPRLENAITSAQSRSDGGTRPDGSTESAVRGWLGLLAVLEAKWQTLALQAHVGRADDVHIDPVRALYALRSLGRMYVGHIADALGLAPARDVFVGPAPVMR